MKNQKRFVLLVPCITAIVFCISSIGRASAADCEVSKDIQWRLGPATWSFRLFSFYESIDKTKDLGLKYVEAYEKQRISKSSPEKLTRKISDETIRKIRHKLDNTGIKLTSIYISHVPGDEDGCREVFEFARKLGVGTIVSEPNPKNLDLIEKFCNKYKINMALHNHPEGKSRYWHPREVLKACEGRGERIGACVDLGHWQRSGINPVEGVRMLGRRIISFHIKDINKLGDLDAHDVPWGEGMGDLKETFEEIHRLGLDPTIFAIEYEYNWENSMPEISKCVEFFKQQAEKFMLDEQTGTRH